MSAPRQSSSLAAGLEMPRPILQPLRDTSEPKLLRMDPIQEKSADPEDEPCQPCSRAPLPAVEEELVNSQTEPSDVISEYVTKMREAIKRQGERLQHEEAKTPGVGDARATKENDKLDFHIKVVRKGKPTPLLLDAKVQGKDLFSTIKSKARPLSVIFPKKMTSKSGDSDAQSRTPKRISASRSRGKRVLVLLPPVWLKLRKQGETRPKTMSNNVAPPAASPVEQRRETKERPADVEEVALLSFRSPLTSPTDSFNASHFYTPTVPSRSRYEYEYRLEKSRFRRTVDIAREAASRSASSVRFHASNVLSVRRRFGEWSKIE